MARKRMISPEIWESQDFSSLSDLAKIVFISLFSHADDEGRGRADPTFIKSSTFPYDEDRRVADIKSALSEIARSMSVQFYSVNGIEFYFMTSWERWQKVEKPSKSKLPPPPIVGVGGEIRSNEKFPERSPTIPRTFPEASLSNRIEQNRKECIYSRTHAREDTHTFVKPTVEEITAYGIEIGKAVNAQRFYDFYESKGWTVGSQPMRDWKACVRKWEEKAEPQLAVNKEKQTADKQADKASELKHNLMNIDPAFYENERALRLANIAIAKGDEADLTEILKERERILAAHGLTNTDIGDQTENE